MTARHNLPTFRQFLAEDDGDIVSGLKSLISQIRSGWSSNLSGVKKQQNNLWKKLTPAQRVAMKRLFDSLVAKMFTAPNQVVDTSTIDATDRNEAAFIVATCALLATGAQQIDTDFLNAMINEKVIDKKQRDEFIANYKASGPIDVALGNVTADFLNKHKDILKQLIDVQEETLGFNVSQVVTNLVTAIRKTDEAKRIESVRGLHYFLLDLSHEFNLANKTLAGKFKAARLPEQPKV